MRKLLIVDASQAFAASVAEQMSSVCDVHICCDGREVLSAVQSTEPDLVELDLMMPGFDGIRALEILEEQERKIPILATVRFSSGYLDMVCERFHLDYMMVHPLNIDVVTARLMDMLSYLDHEDHAYTASLTKLLNKLGFHRELGGYKCLMLAIPMIVKEPDLPYSKVVYSQVADQLSRTGEQVEKIIRYDIARTWEARNNGIWQEYFPCDGNGNVLRPTNRQFISRIAAVLRREY